MARGDCDRGRVVVPVELLTLVDRVFRAASARASPPAPPLAAPSPSAATAAVAVAVAVVDGTIRCSFVGDFKSPIEARVA